MVLREADLPGNPSHLRGLRLAEPLLTLAVVRLYGEAVWGHFILAESIAYFGTRLATLGLDKGMLCTHLKRWSLRNMIVTDIFGRALPWTRMIIEQEEAESNLNVSPAEKLKAGLSGILTLSVAAGFWDVRIWGLSIALLGLAYYVNHAFFALIGRRNGFVHLLGCCWNWYLRS